MQTFKSLRTQFVRQCEAFAADERGTTAIEYGIIAVGVAAVIVAAVHNVGSELKTSYYNKVLALF